MTRPLTSVAPQAEKLLERFGAQHLINAPGSIVALLPDWTIAWVNSAWTAFARANDGAADFHERFGVGSRYSDAIPAVLRTYYTDAFERSLATGQVWEHEYECSSPTRYRLFHLRGLPHEGGGLLVLVHSLRVERAHDAARQGAWTLADYVDARGLLNQCAHCRRVRSVIEPERWDWVPRLVSHPFEHTTHGLCEVCYHYYFPEI